MTDEQGGVITVTHLKLTEQSFPKPSALIDGKIADRTRSAIAKSAVVTADGKTAINIKGLGAILQTDKVGVSNYVSDLDDDDKISVGNEHYVRTPEVRKELDKRIEKPFDAKKREQLKDSAKCLEAVRDNQLSEQIRSVQEVKIREGQKKLKDKKVARDGITHCKDSNEPLTNDAHAHHNIRRADDPDKALDLNNIDLLNPKPHEERHRVEREEANKLF